MSFWLLNRFSRKLTSAFCLTILATMITTAFLVTRAVRTFLIKDLAENLSIEARLLSDQLAPTDLKPEKSKDFNLHIQHLSEILGGRISIVAPNGVVLADSSVPFDELKNVENHKDRPEIVEALAGANGHAFRHSHTINKDLLYVAIPWKKNDQLLGVIRVALYLDKIHEKVGLINQTIIWISLGVILVAILLAYFLSKSIGQPIIDISNVVYELAGGSYAKRIPNFKNSEHNQLSSAINHLAETIETTISDLNRDRTQLSSILGNMVEAVVAVDAAGRIVMVNPALAELFHIDANASQGRPFLESLRHNQLNQILNSVISDGRGRVDEVKTFSPDERIFDAHAVPLNRNGQLTGVLLVLHDITRLRKLEQLRKEFVANVSHELRTPLASMKGYAETLRLGAVDDKEHRTEFLQSIETQAEQMTRLVDDLLDLAAIESGKRVIQKQKIQIPELVNEIVRSLKHQAEQKKVKLLVGPAKLPDIMGDPVQIKQVITNLLDNAIKFNRPNGEIKISFATDGKYFRTDVQDSGMGIPSEDVHRVFERFYRVDKARSRELGGTGLGLSIVKHIVEAHGGFVSVQSQEEVGSTFSFSLPLF